MEVPAATIRETGTAPEEAEAALVAAALTDRAAFTPLYRRYVGPVYGYCYHRLGGREAAEDATGRVFNKALPGLPGLNGGSFRGWLFTIAHHEIAGAYRSRIAEAPLEAAAELVDPTPSPEDQAESAEARRELLAALDCLPPDQRLIVELRLAGLTSAEISQVVGRTRGAVDVAHSRAVGRLRSLMSNTEGSRHGA